MSGVSKYEHVTPIIKQLEWLKIKEKNIYGICIMSFKIIKNEFPEGFMTLQTIINNPTGNTRQNNNLQVNRY